MNKVFNKTNILLATLVLIWGAVWPINKIALAYIPPFLYASLRTLFGGILLAMIIAQLWKQLKWKQHWKAYTISAIFNTVLFFGLHSVGLLYLPGGLFSVIIYLQPLLLAFLSWLVFGENLTILKISGLCIGFIGIFIVSVDGLTTHLSIIGVLFALATGISWAVGVIFVKKVSIHINLYWMIAMQNIIGGFILLVISLFTEDWSTTVWNVETVFGVVYGFTLGVPIAYIIYYYLVNNGNASKIGSITFLIPILSVVISVIFVNEPLTSELFIGMLLVGLSIYLVNYEKKKPSVQ